MVFRIFKNKNFTTMNNYFLRDRNLSWKGKGLLAVMLSNCDEWEYSLAGLCAMVPDKETSTKTALEELKKLGYLEVIKKMPDETMSGRIEYEYRIYEVPKNKIEQEYKKQGLEILGLEIQPVEKQALRNTNPINTNRRNTIEEGKKDISSSSDSDISKEKRDGDSINHSLAKKRFSGINPSLDEIKAYIREKGYHFSAEEIQRYYTSDGSIDVWRFRDGKLVRDWKRCCMTFEDHWKERYGSSYQTQKKSVDDAYIESLKKIEKERSEELDRQIAAFEAERKNQDELSRIPF